MAITARYRGIFSEKLTLPANPFPALFSKYRVGEIRTRDLLSPTQGMDILVEIRKVWDAPAQSGIEIECLCEQGLRAVKMRHK